MFPFFFDINNINSGKSCGLECNMVIRQILIGLAF